MKRGIFVAAHESVLFGDEIKWCGRLYSGEATWPDPDGIQGLFVRAPLTEEWGRADSLHPCSALVALRLAGTGQDRNSAAWSVGGVCARNKPDGSGGESAAEDYRKLDGRAREGVGVCSGTRGPGGTDLSW